MTHQAERLNELTSELIALPPFVVARPTHDAVPVHPLLLLDGHPLLDPVLVDLNFDRATSAQVDLGSVAGVARGELAPSSSSLRSSGIRASSLPFARYDRL